MEQGILLAAFFGIQVLLFALDMGDRFLCGAAGSGEDRLRFAAIGLLLAVTLVFSLLQYAGLTLIPKVDDMFAAMRTLFESVLSQPRDDQILQGRTLVLVAIVAYYIAGLWDYLIHRFVSHARPFWFTHEYHHLPNQVFIAMPGIFVRPFAAFPSFLTSLATGLSIYCGLLLIGTPLWELTSLFPVVLVIGVVLTASHSCFLRRWRLVHRVMSCFGLTTPQEHLLHHTIEMNGNYGNFTTVWDRVFGTYLDPMLEQNRDRALGLPYDQDFLGTLTFGRLKLPAAIRMRCQLSRYCNIHDSEPADDDRPEQLTKE